MGSVAQKLRLLGYSLQAPCCRCDLPGARQMIRSLRVKVTLAMTAVFGIAVTIYHLARWLLF